MTGHPRLMWRAMLAMAVLALVTRLPVGDGVARGDLITYQGDLTGVSDQGGYWPNFTGQFVPLPPTAFDVKFRYIDDGVTTSFQLVITGPDVLGPDAVYPYTWTEADSAIAKGYPPGPATMFPSMFYIDSSNIVHIDTTQFQITSGGQQLLPIILDGSGPLSSFSGYAFSGGDYGYIGGPVTGSIIGVPESSTLAMIARGIPLVLCFWWYKRRHSIART